MKITKNGDCTVITLEGRLDTVTAPELTEAITGLEFTKLVVEMKDLAYISSSGLRALLVCTKIANKRKAPFCVKNPAPAVLEVMRMSGFDKILTIEQD